MDTNALKELGISETEIKVYLALLDIGSGLAGEITKKSGVNRTNVYDALERLIEKGLVTFVITANRKVFEPVNPEKFQEILKEKESNLKKILPDLKERFKTPKTKEIATIFKGKKGIKSAFDECLKEKRDIYVYGAQSKFADMFPAYQKNWNQRRTKQNTKIKMISTEKARKRKTTEGLKLIKFRFLPKQYDFPSTVMISGEKVFTTTWTSPPLCFMMKSKEAVKTHINFFELLWNISKP